MKFLDNVLNQLKRSYSFPECREVNKAIRFFLLLSITSFCVSLLHPINTFVFNYINNYISYSSLFIVILLVASKFHTYPNTCYHFALAMERIISKFSILFISVLLLINISGYLNHVPVLNILLAQILLFLPVGMFYAFSKHLKRKYQWQGKAYQLFMELPTEGQIFFFRKVLTGLGFHIEDSNCRTRDIKIPVSTAPRISIKIRNPLFWVSYRKGKQKIFIAELKPFPSQLELNLAIQILKKLAEEGLVLLIAPTPFLSNTAQKAIKEILTVKGAKLINGELKGLVPTFYTEMLNILLSNKETKPIFESLTRNRRKEWNG